MAGNHHELHRNRAQTPLNKLNQELLLRFRLLQLTDIRNADIRRYRSRFWSGSGRWR